MYEEGNSYTYDIIDHSIIQTLNFTSHKLWKGSCVYIGEVHSVSQEPMGVGILLSKELLISKFMVFKPYDKFIEVKPEAGYYHQGYSYRTVLNDRLGNIKNKPKIVWSEGEYKNSLLDGFVKQKDSNGNYYEFTFIKGVKHGPAKIYSTDGNILEVNYFNNKKHGVGITTTPDGKSEVSFYYLAY